MRCFTQNCRGSATQWFALAAALVATFSVAGVQGLAWLTEPGRLSVVAYRAPAGEVARSSADTGVDPTPTGSIPPTGVMIRINR